MKYSYAEFLPKKIHALLLGHVGWYHFPRTVPCRFVFEHEAIPATDFKQVCELFDGDHHYVTVGSEADFGG